MSSKTIAVMNYGPHFAEDFFDGVAYTSSREGNPLDIRIVNSAEQIGKGVDLIVLEPWNMSAQSLDDLLKTPCGPPILVVTNQDPRAFPSDVQGYLSKLDPVYLCRLSRKHGYLSQRIASL